MARHIKTTEQDSHYDKLESMSVRELLRNMNREDQVVPLAVKKALPAIENLVKVVSAKMKKGGRLIYMGAGTSGRLGILDASECPPTFGIEQGRVIGLIAGGDQAIRKAVEFAEDDVKQGWKDLQNIGIHKKDVVVGIAASGSTPYVLGALIACRKKGISTACITCNKGSEMAKHADYPVEVVVGPEFVSGSTRMKSGTAQKLVLNMLSTSVMIKLGRVKGNKMVDMQLSNTKLIERGTKMLMKNTGLKNPAKARGLLIEHGSVRKATAFIKTSAKQSAE
ncbi:MAG TPA: N-acetylmuramic acid 6-phosphate etherase [Bacteroidia bacterium]|nr:N-acetylmuramic acid 6-phosphate etherase [Bacteroidia bacterium]